MASTGLPTVQTANDSVQRSAVIDGDSHRSDTWHSMESFLQRSKLVFQETPTWCEGRNWQCFFNVVLAHLRVVGTSQALSLTALKEWLAEKISTDPGWASLRIVPGGLDRDNQVFEGWSDYLVGSRASTGSETLMGVVSQLLHKRVELVHARDSDQGTQISSTVSIFSDYSHLLAQLSIVGNVKCGITSFKLQECVVFVHKGWHYDTFTPRAIQNISSSVSSSHAPQITAVTPSNPLGTNTRNPVGASISGIGQVGHTMAAPTGGAGGATGAAGGATADQGEAQVEQVSVPTAIASTGGAGGATGGVTGGATGRAGGATADQAEAQVEQVSVPTATASTGGAGGAGGATGPAGGATSGATGGATGEAGGAAGGACH